MRQPELWIGVVELKPLNRVTFGAAGAFTHIVTWAGDIDGFRKKADEAAATLDMFVFDVEWAEPIIERRKNWTLTEEIDGMATQAESNPNAILYGTFYTYPFNDA